MVGSCVSHRCGGLRVLVADMLRLQGFTAFAASNRVNRSSSSAQLFHFHFDFQFMQASSSTTERRVLLASVPARL
ncbi:hypothetical protein GW17_00048983 [Ensete ventricosum]|nr:hypothetical protein GW17_00048983 [Ensete ventricosum]